MARIPTPSARVAALATWLLAGSLVLPLAATAQDPSTAPTVAATPSPMCSVLTAQEASDALGVTLTVGSSSATDCSWDADPFASDVSLIAWRDVGDLDLDVRSAFEGQDLTVADRDAYFIPGGPSLIVSLDDDLLFGLELYGTPSDGVDPQAAMAALAELALPRLGGVPVPPEATDEPEPSMFHDTALESLMPEEVDGSLVDVGSLPGTDLPNSVDVEDARIQAALTALEAGLQAQGTDLSDLTIATGVFPTESSYGQIVAVRATVADLAPLTDPILGVLLPDLASGGRTATQVAGRDVMLLTEVAAGASPDPSADPFELPPLPAYVLRSDDVLWVVYAEDAIAQEVIGQLP